MIIQTNLLVQKHCSLSVVSDSCDMKLLTILARTRMITSRKNATQRPQHQGLNSISSITELVLLMHSTVKLTRIVALYSK